MNHSGNININGDGNAVGNNINILVDKRIYLTITHNSPPGGSGEPGAGGGPSHGGNLVATAVLVLIVIGIAAWKFATYADVLYLAGILASLTVAGAQLLALGVGLWRSIPTSWLVDRIVGLLAASAVFYRLLLEQASVSRGVIAHRGRRHRVGKFYVQPVRFWATGCNDAHALRLPAGGAWVDSGRD